MEMSIIDHTLIKYMLFPTYLDLLPLNIVYFVLKIVILSWKIIFPWLWELYIYIYIYINIYPSFVNKC